MKSFILKLLKYAKYPNILQMDIHKLFASYNYKKYNLEGFPPNYIYFNSFNENSVIIDVGCGFAAEFSTRLIDNYGVKAFAVDPTNKHRPFLNEISKKYPSNFNHLSYALAAKNGQTVFYESKENESGSLIESHKNIQHDTVVAYNVEIIDIKTLLRITGADVIDIMKIDIEGAEFELFDENNLEALKSVKQLFVEFHHITVSNRKKKDTLVVVSKIKNQGFKSYSYDGVNYLFFREK